jgi:hypothetical protein
MENGAGVLSRFATAAVEKTPGVAMPASHRTFPTYPVQLKHDGAVTSFCIAE